jgi:hypothetical protein
MSLRLGIDLDGVVADFRSAFREAAQQAGVDLSPPEARAADTPSSGEIKRIWEHIRQTPNWWVGVKPYEPAQIARLYELSRRLRWEVVFMTRRPETAGDTVQFQSQWWLEAQGFLYPAVVTVPGSRGEMSNALRLDMAVDDQVHNCVDIISASTTKTLLLLRDAGDATIREHATSRGIGVIATLEEAIDIFTNANDVTKERRGRLQRLSDWFTGTSKEPPGLPRRTEQSLTNVVPTDERRPD